MIKTTAPLSPSLPSTPNWLRGRIRLGFAAAVFLCIGTAPSQSEARTAKTKTTLQSKAHHKSKQAKTQRRSARKAKPRILRSQTKAMDQKAETAIKTGSLDSLMTRAKGRPVLNMNRFSPGMRSKLVNTIKMTLATPGVELNIEMGKMKKLEREALAKSLFAAQPGSSMATQAWASAAIFTSMSVKKHQITYTYGNNDTVTFTTSLVGMQRVRRRNGQVTSGEESRPNASGKWAGRPFEGEWR